MICVWAKSYKRPAWLSLIVNSKFYNIQMRKLDTILVTPEEKANLDNAEHPLFYYHSKNQILENMADNIKLQGRMG